MPDWNDVLKEIQVTVAQHGQQAQLHSQAAQGALDTIRRKYLQALRDNTGRNVIAYYSGFLSKPDAPMLGITDEDKNGFMMAVHSIGGQDRRRGLDLILHTPGGSIAATESLVDYLHRIFENDIRAIIPTNSHVGRHDDRMFVQGNTDGTARQSWAHRPTVRESPGLRCQGRVQEGM